MSVQLKVKESATEEKRRAIVRALERAGFEAHSLFPKQRRSRLASIYTISAAGSEDLSAINSALIDYSHDIEYVEPAPERSLKD